MQTYKADVTCAEPVAPGFSCATVDELSFSYATNTREPLTFTKIQEAIKDVANKVCWKCLGSRWKVHRLTPVSYQASYEMHRG